MNKDTFLLLNIIIGKMSDEMVHFEKLIVFKADLSCLVILFATIPNGYIMNQAISTVHLYILYLRTCKTRSFTQSDGNYFSS